MRKGSYFNKTELELFNNQSPIFSKTQMKIINRVTPKSEIEIKTDKGRFEYKSVKAAYVKALIMLVSGGKYSFEIKSREFIPSTREVLVEAKLSIHVGSEDVFIREQFGQHYLNIKTDINGNTTKTYASDIGNGYKAAASDAFKKCASEFGFCWDIYGQEHAENKKQESPPIDHAEIKKLERLEHFLLECKLTKEIEHVYNKYLETAKETKTSLLLMKKHMNRIIKA